jgi:peptide/nickel transport system substrate-binding protein
MKLGPRGRLYGSLGVLVIVPALLGLNACGSSSNDTQQGGEMVANLTSYPDYLDPQLSYTAEGWEALYPTYTPLLTYAHEPGEAGTEVIPGLAEDLPDVTPDGKTYDLTLRKGMEYSDGTPIKACDFKFAVERMFDVNSGGSSFYTDIVGAADYQKGSADEISGIECDDDSGDITINLEEPRGTFQQELALMFVAPVPPDTPKDENQTKSPPPSSGPFTITDVKPGRTFVMKKNPKFQTILDAGADIPEAQVDEITVEEVKNTSTQVTDVEQNEVDYMFDPPAPDRLPEVEQKYADRFRFEDSINVYYFWMNNAEPPFDDVKVRQAVNYAIDPAALTRLFGGRLNVSQTILPEGMPGHKDFELYPGPDIEKAKQLIEEADPSDTDITVWTNDEPDRKKLGAYYQDVLNDIGFNADLKIINGEIYFAQIGNQKTENLDTGFSDWFQDYPHPNDFFQPLLSGESIQPTNNQNNSLTDIPALNKKIDELAQEEFTPEVQQQYGDLDEAFMKEAVWAPYGSERFTTFVSDRLNFDEVFWHPLMSHDWTSFALNEGS